MAPIIVDLTRDEVVVRMKGPAPTGAGAAGAVSDYDSDVMEIIPPAWAQSNATSSLKRTPNPSPRDQSATRLDSAMAQGTPSKTARFSTREPQDQRGSLLRSQPHSRPSSSQSDRQFQHHHPHPQNPTPQSSQRAPRALQNQTQNQTQNQYQNQNQNHNQTPKKMDWTVDKIATRLAPLVEVVGHDHARLVDFMLEEAEKKAPQQRHLTAFDDFADMKSIAMETGASPDPASETMVVRFKHHSGEHGKAKGQARRIVYPVTSIKTDKEPVPKYRFHHVEIRKNILTPNTMLNFVPHLRDVDPNSAEERKYSNWLTELEKMDHQSGFKTQDRAQKFVRRARDEYAATISMYLELWLRKLAIDGCTKSTLIRFMASQPEHDDAITPQQKSTILNTYSSQEIGSPQTSRGARMFTEAFDRVFDDPNKSPRVTLREILLLDKSVEIIVDNKRAKDTPSSQKHRDVDLLPKIEANLASYSILGCLICFSHDCEHGEFDSENQRGTFSVEGTGGLVRTLKGKWQAQIEAQKDAQQNGVSAKSVVLHQPCRNQCYRSYDVGNPAHPVEPWEESEIQALEQVFATIGYSTTLKAQCFVAAVLGRNCWDVYRKLKELNLSLPHVEPRTELPKVKAIPWYDRKKKQLIGDWQDYTTSHEHAMREISEPCHHEGPCTAANGCPCALAYPHPVLCERFCHCTADECALKFTGCACHSSGKTCLQRQKEGRPCICVQLNRECDPVLCKGCGARERADPENALDDHLHSTGCQNVPLQRGAAKVVMLGKSQLEGCGYGLFTAEDIAQDEFVIEYTGELITHDEGVRREARRGDVFDEQSTSSYLFTLLEHEGIWVDAAIYGNLSRYINHASEHDRKGCNITPKIMYVNHEFRIKFSALRDIKAGEELFFNYGDNFPNLTKKLLEQDEDKQTQGGEQKRKGGAQRGDTARKTTTKGKGPGKAGRPKKAAVERASSVEEDPMDWMAGTVPVDDDDDMADEWEEHTPRRRKKRGGRRPGAGRKKKQPPVTEGDGGPRIAVGEISDSQGESPMGRDVPGATGTPTRRRQLKHSLNSNGSEAEPGIVIRGGGSGSGGGSSKPTTGGETATSTPPVKKVSKRGGARPGAGRKPKHPKPAATPKTDAAKANNNTTNGSSSKADSTAPENGKSSPTDSDDVPLMSSVHSGRSRAGLNNSGAYVEASSYLDSGSSKPGDASFFAPSEQAAAGLGGGGAGAPATATRKRKANEIESGDDEITSSFGGSRTGGGGGGSVSIGGGVGGAGGEGGGSTAAFPFRLDHFQLVDDYDDEESLADRQARKRQKPLRYRNDER